MTVNPPPPPMDDSLVPTVPTRQTAWPTVIGIIAIVLGSLALLQNGLCAPVGLAMSGAFQGMMEDLSEAAPQANMDIQVAQFEAMKELMPQQLTMALVAAAVAAVLLVGGVRLVRRRANAAGTIRLWAVLKMVIAIPLAWLNYVVSQAQFAAMAEAAADSASTAQPQMPAGFFSALEGLGGVMSAMMFLWFWALPLFMLIWFARRPIQEEVAGWKSAVSEGQ